MARDARGWQRVATIERLGRVLRVVIFIAVPKCREEPALADIQRAAAYLLERHGGRRVAKA